MITNTALTLLFSDESTGVSPIAEIGIENANTGATSSAACDVTLQVWGLVHGIALDTLTYRGSDSLKVRKHSNWNLYKAAQTDTILAADSTVISFVDSMKTTVFGELDSLRGELKWNLDSTKTANLLAANTKVTTADSLESLLKEVNELALKYVLPADTLLDSTNRAKLIDIAALCPLYHGPAVYDARRYLSLYR